MSEASSRHVWVSQAWPGSQPASPAVQALHCSSLPSSRSPAAVTSPGHGPAWPVRQPVQRTTVFPSYLRPVARADQGRQTMEAFGDHTPQAASLVGASRGDDLFSPVRQAAQPPQQTTVDHAYQHSPAHAVPVVAQAAFQGGHVPHASPAVKLNPEDQVATFAKMQGHMNPGMPRHFHMPEGATDFVPGGAAGPPPQTQMWWDSAPGLSPLGCCNAQGQAGCCPTGKSPGARPGSGLHGCYASPMGHAHAPGPARGVPSPAVGGLGSVGVGQGSYVVNSNVRASARTLDEDVQAVCFALIVLSSSCIMPSHTNSSHNIFFFPTPDLAWLLPIGFFSCSSPLGIPAAAGGHGHV